MSEPLKKLLSFLGIFGVAAIILAFFMPKKPAQVVEQSTEINVTMPDSIIHMNQHTIDQLKGLLKNDPDNIQHLIQVGNLYFDISRPADAIEYYEKALALDGTNPFVLTDCAVMYYQLGKSDTALAYLEKALTLKPDLPQAHFNRGLIYLTAKDDRRSAIASWEKFLTIAPDTVQANFVRQQIELAKAGTQ